MNTNYVIKRVEISDFQRKVKDVITNYNNALDSLESTIKGTIDDLGMQGKSAENIKRYLTDIHINAFIKSIRSIMDTYYNNLIMFEYGYMLIDITFITEKWMAKFQRDTTHCMMQLLIFKEMAKGSLLKLLKLLIILR